MKKCGIYIIKNNVNNLVYIGQSVDIECRWNAHLRSAKNLHKQDENTKIHKAMREIGIKHFYYEILEECPYSELNNKEIFWIKKFDSYNHGYNMTLGGENNRGETNGRAILKQSDVEDIRMAYANHIPFREVFKKYENVISKKGLQNVWHLKTWKHIMPEVYTDENMNWHKTYAKAHINGNKQYGENNKQRACTSDEIQQMRNLRKQGLSYLKIAEITNRSQSVVRKYCLFQESKNPDKIDGIQVKNLETGLVFSSLTKAGKWASTTNETISKYLNTKHSAGFVPTTNKPAHWIHI